MIIFASDLSLSCPGFAVVAIENYEVQVLHISHVKTNSKKSRGYRLFEIYNHMKAIYEEFPGIDVVAREKGFSRFPATTQALFSVVGIHTVCAYKYGYDVIEEFSPTTIKKTITGNGKADKTEVMHDISNYISTNTNTDIKFKTDDESDALSAAITYAKKKKLLV